MNANNFQTIKIALLLLFYTCCFISYADTDTVPVEENYLNFERNIGGTGNDIMAAWESNKVPTSS